MTVDEDIKAVGDAVAKLFELGPDEEAVVTVYADPRRGPQRSVIVYLPDDGGVMTVVEVLDSDDVA